MDFATRLTIVLTFAFVALMLILMMYVLFEPYLFADCQLVTTLQDESLRKVGRTKASKRNKARVPRRDAVCVVSPLPPPSYFDDRNLADH